MKIYCPFCGEKHNAPIKEKSFRCDCGSLAGIMLSEDAYLFYVEAAEYFGLKSTEWVEGGGYIVADNPNRFMEFRDAGIVGVDSDGYKYIMRWARKRDAPLPSSVPVKLFARLYAERWAKRVKVRWEDHPTPSVATVGRWANERRGGMDWGYQLHTRMWMIFTEALEVAPPAKGAPHKKNMC